VKIIDTPTVIVVDNEEAPELMKGLKDSEPGQFIAPHNTVFLDIQRERDRQDKKWGQQNHPNWLPSDIGGELDSERRAKFYGIETEADAKLNCDNAFGRGKGNWGHIFIEEVAECIEANNDNDLETELIQVASVAVAWVECIRRRRGVR
jgi:hypothetical protein